MDAGTIDEHGPRVSAAAEETDADARMTRDRDVPVA
jgi:hypothetical protein